MKEAVVSIRGIIGYGGFDWETFEMLPDAYGDVTRQLQNQRPFDSVKVEISSEGGYVSVGRDVRIMLASLNVPITTVALSRCMSIATEIFAIGQKRQIVKGCVFMIHKPYSVAIGNEDDFENSLAAMRNTTQEMVDLYVAVTGKSEEEIRSWMVRDNSMSAEQAVENGFATEIIYQYPFNQPDRVQAKARMEPIMAFNPPKTMENPMQALNEKLTAIGKGISDVLAKLSPTRSKALALTLLDGREVNIETTENNPQTGDALTIAGEKPENGEYTLSDNQILTVADGKITEIKAPETTSIVDTAAVDAAVVEEMAALRTQNQQLQAQLTTQKTAYEAEKQGFLAQFDDLSKQLTDIGKATHSNYNPDTRQFEGRAANAGNRDPESDERTKKKLAEIQAQKKKELTIHYR